MPDCSGRAWTRCRSQPGNSGFPPVQQPHGSSLESARSAARARKWRSATELISSTGTPEDLNFVQIDESGDYGFCRFKTASTALALSRSSEMSMGWRELMKILFFEESS